MARSGTRLGKVQLRIMQVLWEAGSATAREITDRLSQEEAIAHSTVQTLLRQMEAKGAVTHEVRERTFVFRPVSREGEVTESATREFLARFFGGSVCGMVAHLLQNERIAPEEIEKLRSLIRGEEES